MFPSYRRPTAVFRNYAWFVRGATHSAMCRTSIESVKKADRFARCIVVTEHGEPFETLGEDIHLTIDAGMPIMLANLEAQVRTLALATDPVYFIDADTILVKPFDVGACDVAFTWRDNVGVDDDGEKVEGVAARMPYNYGVVVANRTHGAMEAFIWMRERVRVMHSNHQQWFGNQLAAAELAGPRPSGDGVEFAQRTIPWRLTNQGMRIGVLKLPCALYNYTPQVDGEDVSSRYLLHFKGGRRDLMPVYADAMGLGWYLPREKNEKAA
jgi:hypothetical protein